MSKLSPSKNPVYYRLENRAHLAEWDHNAVVPQVDFASRNASKSSKRQTGLDDTGDRNDEEETGNGNILDFTRASEAARKRRRVNVLRQDSIQPPNWKTKLIVIICGIIIIIGVGLIIHFHETRPRSIIIGDPIAGAARLILSHGTLDILDKEQETRLTISIGGDNLDSFRYETAQKCGKFESDAKGICLRWTAYNTTLEVVPVRLPDSPVQCYNISWTYLGPDTPRDCFYLNNDDNGEKKGQPVWYDTLHFIVWSRFRADSCENSCHDYVPIHDKNNLDIGGTVVEPLWISSQGNLVKANLHSRLEACLKGCKDASRPKLCLGTKSDDKSQTEPSVLSYLTCSGSNVTQLRNEIMAKIIIPDSKNILDLISGQISDDSVRQSTKSIWDRCSSLFEKPLWNIAFNGEAYSDASAIEAELSDIATIGGTGIVYNISNVYSKIGDFELHMFQKAKAGDFISAMHRMNFAVMLPVSCFVNYDASLFQEAVRKGFVLRNEFNTAPALGVTPMLGSAIYPAVVDFTNPDAFAWFVKNVKNFTKNSNVDFIQFLYGQTSWLPGKFHSNIPISNLGFYSTSYANVADYLDSCPLTDVAFASQNQNQIVMLGPVSGLEETLKMALASGMAGYPFFVPNLPFRLEEVGMLSPQMLEDGFIRWVQLVSFFPVPHMPWDFQTLKNRGINITRLVDMVKKCLALRNSPTINQALKLAIENAENTRRLLIISPIWASTGLPVVSTQDFTTERIFLIENQFMIGRDVMFAPILEMKVSSRAVYFPRGRWAKLTDPDMKPIDSDGKLWVNDFPVALDDLLIFVRKS